MDVIVDPLSSRYVLHRALDLFLWILSVQTAGRELRSASSGTSSNCVNVLEKKLMALIDKCLLKGDRAIAHKVTKIIITTLESFTAGSEEKYVFEESILDALLNSIDDVVTCESAGAMFWFFSILNRVKWSNQWNTATKVSSIVHFINNRGNLPKIFGK